MNKVNLKNAWEFYRTYMSVSRHVMSKENGWKYDLFRNGLWESVDQQKFTQNPRIIEMWSNIAAEVLEIHPSINRMNVINAFAMTFFLNNNKFYCNENSSSDIITSYTKYKELLNIAEVEFKRDISKLSILYKNDNLKFKDGLCQFKTNEVPCIMKLFYSDEISLTTLYILNNLFKASNTNNLSLMTYLRNVDNSNVFLKMFAKNVDMWELIFEVDYKSLGVAYIKVYNEHNKSI